MSKEVRARAKAVNFGIVYGISPFGLAANLGIDQKEARTYIETYFDRYKGVQKFIADTIATTRETGKVSTLFGRTRPIPDIQSRNPNARGFAERTAVNTPLQGTAADMIKVAMLRIDAALRDRKLATRMTLQVHDELLFDAPRQKRMRSPDWSSGRWRVSLSSPSPSSRMWAVDPTGRMRNDRCLCLRFRTVRDHTWAAKMRQSKHAEKVCFPNVLRAAHARRGCPCARTTEDAPRCLCDHLRHTGRLGHARWR